MICENKIIFIKKVLHNMPDDWLKLTTHRLDVYNEELAKIQFLEQLENIFSHNYTDQEVLKKALKLMPTAYDYIRLGHPLSSILEWVIAKSKDLNEENVICFSSQTMPILAILRKNLLTNIETKLIYKNELPKFFDAEILKNIYGYKFELVKIENYLEISSFNGSNIVLTEFNEILNIELTQAIDFVISIHPEFGSVALVNGEKNQKYISEIQHVRRRESIAMTPIDCFTVLEGLIGKKPSKRANGPSLSNKNLVLNSIKEITNTTAEASIGSSGLSIQYAIMMGLIHHSLDKYKGQDIKFIVPPNCYGGTNDQARRVAACIENVEVVDLLVDGGQDMVQSIEKVLDQVASQDAVPFIIAEIPTNPRVEVPDLNKLRQALSKNRKTKDGKKSIGPVFILDQTFCPNVKFLGPADILSSVKTISYVSGSKFPSGGACTAGYCVANKKAEVLMSYIDNHLKICSNEAIDFQIEVLSGQMPSMLQRIKDAYKVTREFVNFIKETLPQAKINFVSEELANIGFTPSVFSLDLPTSGDTVQEQESYKRNLNLKLINMMINEIPDESKHCVSYGQLKGCYWTIPATSTQGTTKEGDKDYIVRVAMSPDLDLKLHKKVFADFCKTHIN
jgi:cystathionine beta-lyase/cystathionine gamma-synthase